MGGVVKWVQSNLGTCKSHNDSEKDLQPCALDNERHKELCDVRENQRGKDEEVASPDLRPVLQFPKRTNDSVSPRES